LGETQVGEHLPAGLRALSRIANDLDYVLLDHSHRLRAVGRFG